MHVIGSDFPWDQTNVLRHTGSPETHLQSERQPKGGGPCWRSGPHCWAHRREGRETRDNQNQDCTGKTARPCCSSMETAPLYQISSVRLQINPSLGRSMTGASELIHQGEVQTTSFSDIICHRKLGRPWRLILFFAGRFRLPLFMCENHRWQASSRHWSSYWWCALPKGTFRLVVLEGQDLVLPFLPSILFI